MNSYKSLLKSQPNMMTKEQFRLVAGIGKQAARYYLQTGLLPCENTGKKTRNYRIPKENVLQFLLDRDANPQKYRLPKSKELRKTSYRQVRPMTKEETANFEQRLMGRMVQFPDVMAPDQVANFLEYHPYTVRLWCKSGALKHLFYNNRRLIPKPYLVAYLLADAQCPANHYRSEAHKRILSQIFQYL